MAEKEYWTVTSGDLTQRRDVLPTPAVEKSAGTATKVVVDPSEQFQLWEGEGAAITDSTASLLMHNMSSGQRHQLLEELFSPSQAGFSAVRISIGTCDFVNQKYYSYDDLPEGVSSDGSLKYFSIGTGKPGAPDATRDLKNIIPVLQEILAINPAVKVLASPWSAPAWMKTTRTFAGSGALRLGEYCGQGYRPQDTIDYCYAQYFVKFIAAYASYGIPIHSVTLQNEPTNHPGWPMTFWKPEQLVRWGVDYLRPALDRTFPQVEMWFGDDNLHFFDRPISDYMTPAEARCFAGAAVHTYATAPQLLGNIVRQFPGWKLATTERRCMLDETVDEASHIMFGEIGTWLVNNGENRIMLWNLALDEKGYPSYAKTRGRRGVVTIDSATGKVRRNLEYFMLRNYGQDVPLGSRRIFATNRLIDGRHGGLGATAFLTPKGGLFVQLYNPTGQPITAAITLAGEGPSWQKAVVPAYGTVTLRRSGAGETLNTSSVPKDDEFALDLGASK